MKTKEISSPKMILFDYGQTLVNESKFDGLKGTAEVMKYAVKNRHNYTAEDVQNAANAINDELGRYDPARSHLLQVEVPNCMFSPYLYESMGIELALSNKERDQIFWDAASPGVPTEGILDFLNYLKKCNIRTGVISNITYCGEAVKDRIDNVVVGHNFEFIIATSEYMFRKPNKRIFELALEKANLNPEDVWYIGDNYECDVVGARNAGICPVWYVGANKTPYSEKEDVMTIKKWEDLKRKLGTITEITRKRIYDSIVKTLEKMTIAGGRNTEKDLFGNKGGYQTLLSKNTVGKPCPYCGNLIQKASYMGGTVYFCPMCQDI